MEFDIQKHLISMEERINLRFDKLDTDIEKVSDKTAELEINDTALSGRVTSLEEKASWIFSGIGAALLAAFGAIFPHLRDYFFGHR